MARDVRRDGCRVQPRGLDAAIFAGLGLEFPIPDAIDEYVLAADASAFATELRDLLPDSAKHVEVAAQPMRRAIGRCWPWPKAEQEFLERYRRLCHLTGVPAQWSGV